MFINSFECLNGQGIKTRANDKLSDAQQWRIFRMASASQMKWKMRNSTGHQQKQSVIFKKSVLQSQHRWGEFMNERVKVLSQRCYVASCFKWVYPQGWIGNRAYQAFSRWADALKGPTDYFFCQGPSRRDSEQPVAHWFVSCIDSVNHPVTMRYRRSDEVFCSAYIKIASPQLLPRRLFPRFTAALSRTGLLCGEWCGPKSQAGGEESSWIGKVLDRDSQRRQASILMCARTMSVEYANTF